MKSGQFGVKERQNMTEIGKVPTKQTNTGKNASLGKHFKKRKLHDIEENDIKGPEKRRMKTDTNVDKFSANAKMQNDIANPVRRTHRIRKQKEFSDYHVDFINYDKEVKICSKDDDGQSISLKDGYKTGSANKRKSYGTYSSQEVKKTIHVVRLTQNVNKNLEEKEDFGSDINSFMVEKSTTNHDAPSECPEEIQDSVVTDLHNSGKECKIRNKHTKKLHKHTNDISRHVSYECKTGTCSKIFKTLKTLTSHKKLSHRELFKIICTECSKEYGTFTVYRGHIRSEHSDINTLKFILKNTDIIFEHDSRMEVGEIEICTRCGYRYNKDYEDPDHECVPAELRYYCPCCEFDSMLNVDMQQHLSENHKGKLHKVKDRRHQVPTSVRQLGATVNETGTDCSICDQALDTVGDLKLHVKNKHANRPFVCGVCLSCYGRKTDLNKHMRLHKESDLKCSVCLKEFYQQSRLDVHMLTHTGEKPHQCEVCGKRFHEEKLVKIHIVSQHTDYAETRYPAQSQKRSSREQMDFSAVCHLCGKSFKSVSLLKRHFRHRHEDSGALKCPHCSLAFEEISAFKQHKLMHQTLDTGRMKGVSNKTKRENFKEITVFEEGHPSGMPFKCGVCDKRFGKVQYVQQHIRVVHMKEEDKPHYCQICKRGFKDEGAFRIHMRLHTKSKPYKCRICGKQFRQLGHVKDHLLHHGKPQVKCFLCEKMLKSKGNLRAHVSGHCKTRPFKCPSVDCSATFQTLYPLLAHLSTCLKYVDSKMVMECNFCQEKFNKASIAAHYHSHENDAKFSCEVCQMAFNKYYRLYFHKEQIGHFVDSEFETRINRDTVSKLSLPDYMYGLSKEDLLSQYDFIEVERENEINNKIETTDVSNQYPFDTDIQREYRDVNIEHFDNAGEVILAAEQLTYMASGFPYQEIIVQTTECGRDETVTEIHINEMNAEQEGEQSTDMQNVEEVIVGQVAEQVILGQDNEQPIIMGFANQVYSGEQFIVREDDNQVKTGPCSDFVIVGPHSENVLVGQDTEHVKTVPSTDYTIAGQKTEKIKGQNLAEGQTQHYPAQEIVWPETGKEELIKIQQATQIHNEMKSKTNINCLKENANGSVNDSELVRMIDFVKTENTKRKTEGNIIEIIKHKNIKHKNFIKQFNKYRKPKIHRCQQCNQTFDKVLKLKRHTFSHQMLKHSFMELIINEEEHPTGMCYKCGACGERFRRLYFIQNHVLTEHTKDEDKPYICGICKCGFTIKSTLCNHMRLHNKFKPYKCRICGKQFRLLGHVKYHLLHHGKTHLKCALCGKKMKNRGNLVGHVNMHCKVLPFKCPHFPCEVCGMAFEKYHQLYFHKEKRSHFMNSEFETRCDSTCSTIGKLYFPDQMKRMSKGELLLQYDYIEAGDDNDDPITHTQQPNELSNKHGESTNFQCPQFIQSFDKISALKRHKHSHPNAALSKSLEVETPPPHEALQLENNELIVYEEITTSGVMYTCGTCDERFNDLSHIQQHVLIHANDKNEAADPDRNKVVKNRAADSERNTVQTNGAADLESNKLMINKSESETKKVTMNGGHSETNEVIKNGGNSESNEVIQNECESESNEVTNNECESKSKFSVKNEIDEPIAEFIKNEVDEPIAEFIKNEVDEPIAEFTRTNQRRMLSRSKQKSRQQSDSDSEFAVKKENRTKRGNMKKTRVKFKSRKSIMFSPKLDELRGKGGVVYECTSKRCRGYFTSIQKISHHKMAIHKEKLKHICKICEEYFTNYQLFRSHIRMVHWAVEQVPYILEKTRILIQDENNTIGKEIKICTRCGYLYGVLEDSSHFCTPVTICHYCPFCDFNTELLSGMQEHISGSHKKDFKTVDTSGGCAGDASYSKTGLMSSSLSTTCTLCDIEMETFDSLTQHLNIKHSNNPFVCGLCTSRFVCKSALFKHMKFHKKCELRCTLCDKQFDQQSGFEVHMNTHTGEKPYQCEVCGIRYCDKRSVYTHQMFKHVEHFKANYPNRKIYACAFKEKSTKPAPICHLCGKSVRSLSHHMKVHMNEGLYRCPQCELTFNDRVSLKKHRNVHQTPELTFNGNVRGLPHAKKKDNFKAIKVYEKEHPSGLPYKCTCCDKRFKTDKYLQQHFRIIHTKEEDKPFVCEWCQRGFTMMASLRTHMRLHSNIKPYRCRICDKQFRQLGHVKDHLLHHGKPKFECQLCKKMFKIRGNLRQHVVTHCKISPFKCPVGKCLSAFQSIVTLLKHLTSCLKSLGPNEVLVCGFCKLAISVGDILSHFHIHENESHFLCEICGEFFRNYPRLYFHKEQEKHFVETEFETSSLSKDANDMHVDDSYNTHNLSKEELLNQYDYNVEEDCSLVMQVEETVVNDNKNEPPLVSEIVTNDDQIVLTADQLSVLTSGVVFREVTVEGYNAP